MNTRFSQLKTPYSGLPKTIYVILFARVVNSIGSFIFPFMTLLLTSKVGMNEQTVGKYLLLVSILQIPGSLLGGKLSDVIGRKRTAITFMTLSALFLLSCALFVDIPGGMAGVPWLLILTSFCTSMVNAPNGAMLNDLTTPDNRKQAFSLLYMGMNAGAAIGGIVAGFMFNRFMRLLFIGDALTTLLAVVILAKNIPETKPTRAEMESIGRTDTGTGCSRIDERMEDCSLVQALMRRPRLMVFALLNTVFAFVYAQTGFSLPLQANAIFGESQGAGYYGVLHTINCLEVIVLTTLITHVTRKIRPAWNVSIAGVFYAVGFGMLFITRDFWLFALSTIIWTVGEIVSATNVGVYVANHTPISHRGRFSAIIHIISGTGHAVSPFIMGTFIARRGVVNVWPVIFVLSVVASAAMFMLGSTEKSRPREVSIADQDQDGDVRQHKQPVGHALQHPEGR